MGCDRKEVRQIRTVAIVGMGALGLMYGEHIQKAAGPDSVCFLLDEGRMERYRGYAFSVNGEAVQFSMVAAAKAKPVDLVIVATKYNGLRDAMQVMEKAVDEHTVMISVLNIIRRLNPEGYPSMRQDALAHRPSEVEMFAGTVCRIAAVHGIAVPVNEKYRQIIREREKSYT